MPDIHITVKDLTRIRTEQLTKKIVAAEKHGVLLAANEGAEWIKEEVFEGQRYVGHTFYPDVTAKTKELKRKKGEERVGIDTGNLKTSFDAETKEGGLVGVITGGGQRYGTFLNRWRIGELFIAEHGEAAQEIIKREIRKVL